MDIFKIQFVERYFFRIFSKKLQYKHIIDVGAHIGSALYDFSNNNFTIDAFEPIEKNRIKLIKNFRNYNKINIHSEAVSDSSGTKDFHLALNLDGSLNDFYHSIENIPTDDYHLKGETVQVNAVSLDDLIEKGLLPDKIGLLKIDTEGHDLKVLEGASKLKCEAICVEYWCQLHALGKSPSPLEDMIAILKNRGFNYLFFLIHKNENLFISTEPPDLNSNSWGNIFFIHSDNVELYEEFLDLSKKINDGILNSKLFSILLFFFGQKFTFLDIGANNGDFAKDILTYFNNSTGILFEPNIELFEELNKRFKGNINFKTFNNAFEKRNDSREPNTKTSFNKFLLNLPKIIIKLVKGETQNNTFDSFFFKKLNVNKIDFLKVNADGNELNILRNSKNIIKFFKPIILTKIIFISLNEYQPSFFEIQSFFKKINYKLIDFFNIHYNTFGTLAFCDALFIPTEMYKDLNILTSEGEFYSEDIVLIKSQNDKLQKTCDERLELINSLSDEAKKRLDIINLLNDELNKRK